MAIISALQLRDKMSTLLERVALGEEFIIQYRGKKMGKLTPLKSIKKYNKTQTQAQKAITFFTSKKYDKYLKKIKNDRGYIKELNEVNPAKEKLNLRNFKLSKYEK